jgi:hypothetical protein
MSPNVLFAWLAACAISTLIGYFVASLLWPSGVSRSLTWAFAPPVGFGITAFIFFLFRRPLFTVETLLLVLLAAVWFVRRRRQGGAWTALKSWRPSPATLIDIPGEPNASWRLGCMGDLEQSCTLSLPGRPRMAKRHSEYLPSGLRAFDSVPECPVVALCGKGNAGSGRRAGRSFDAGKCSAAGGDAQRTQRQAACGPARADALDDAILRRTWGCAIRGHSGCAIFPVHHGTALPPFIENSR